MTTRGVPYDHRSETEVLVSHDPLLRRDWLSFMWRPRAYEPLEYELTGAQVDALIEVLAEFRAVGAAAQRRDDRLPVDTAPAASSATAERL